MLLCFNRINASETKTERSVVTLHSLPSLHWNPQSWDVWGLYTEEKADVEKERSSHACKISSLSSQPSHSTACTHTEFSPFRKLLKNRLHFGVQWGFSLWCSFLLWQGYLTCLQNSSSEKQVRTSVSTYKDTHPTHTSTSSQGLCWLCLGEQVLSAAHDFYRILLVCLWVLSPVTTQC